MCTSTAMKRSQNNNNDPTLKKPRLQSNAVPSASQCKPASQRKVFPYGNYDRYYGYRKSPSDGSDPRLQSIQTVWIQSKDVLDIGCNVGNVTLALARDFQPHKVVGIDIDPSLIVLAQKNIKRYQYQLKSNSKQTHDKCRPVHSIPFPYNVSFHQEDYVPENEQLLEGIEPEYDVILCLSLTKWIHFNYGDNGMKRFFFKAFLNLRPGGRFILEPQQWSSYQKKKSLTPEILNTFRTIQFYPNQFERFLLDEVGYDRVETLDVETLHQAKGFQRPLYAFIKADTRKTESNDKNSSHRKLNKNSQP